MHGHHAGCIKTLPRRGCSTGSGLALRFTIATRAITAHSKLPAHTTSVCLMSGMLAMQSALTTSMARPTSLEGGIGGRGRVAPLLPRVCYSCCQSCITAGTETSTADLGRVVVVQVVAAGQLDLVNQVGELPRQPRGVDPAQACRDPAQGQGRMSGKMTSINSSATSTCHRTPASPSITT